MNSKGQSIGRRGRLVVGLCVLALAAGCSSDGPNLGDPAPGATQPDDAEAAPEPEPEPAPEPEPEPAPEPEPEPGEDEDRDRVLLGFIAFGLLAFALTLGLASVARRRTAMSRERRQSDRDDLSQLVELGRWVVDHGIGELLTPMAPAQLQTSWDVVQSRAIDVETQALRLAGLSSDLATGTELHRLAADMAALRATVAENVAWRAQDDPTQTQRILATESTIATRRQAVDYDLRRLPSVHP